VDAATEIFREIIAEERSARASSGDHFATGDANDRIWNSLQKLCLRAPDIYARYMGNPVLDLACRAVLGPGYQIATQVNQVRPGGASQIPHRDYHLGFLSQEQLLEYPSVVFDVAPHLVLQGGVAHVDVSIESGATQFLPYSQKYNRGYTAVLEDEFRHYFTAHFVQLAMKKGDAVFFSPAIFHAAGENRTKTVIRLVNLLQMVSPFAKHMEALDRALMIKTVYPHVSRLSAPARNAVIAATADGYSFPTNLDRDPPIGGLAPESQQELTARAIREGWPSERFTIAIDEQATKRLA
jgi:ectoine hydroxylase-related dioxygenase (phytanoyl-CoA dioxygenase family)